MAAAHPHLLFLAQTGGGGVHGPAAKLIRVGVGTLGQGSRDTNYVQGLGATAPRPSWARILGKAGCPCTRPASVVLHPAVLRDERINDLFHGQVRDELFLGQGAPGDRVKVTHTLQCAVTTGSESAQCLWVLLPTHVGPHLQVLLDVLAVVGDATGCDARLPHELKADLATQVVGDVSLLQHRQSSQAPGRGRRSDACSPAPEDLPGLTFLFSSTWEKSSSMSAKYLSCREASSYAWARRPIPLPQAQAPSHHRHAVWRTPTHGLGHPHVLGLDAGLLGPDVAVVLITLVVPLAFFQLPGGQPGASQTWVRPGEATLHPPLVRVSFPSISCSPVLAFNKHSCSWLRISPRVRT